MRVKPKVERQGNVIREEEDKGTTAEDRLGSLFQPDILLSDDYFANYRRKIPLEPEKALMLAVLEDGIGCFQENITSDNGKKRALRDEAREWLFSEETEPVFSFDSICSALNLDSGYIRRGLRRWEQRALDNAKRKNARRDKLAERLVA